MEPITETSFEILAEQFLGKGFPHHLSGTVSLPELSPETRDFIFRLLDLMKRSGYSLTQFNPGLMRWVSATIPSILPGAWGGHIPPITVPDRHKKLDDYVAEHNFHPVKGKYIFLDVGCGFPPVTTADTARRFPDWHIYGMDRSFADYVLYDDSGHYACFNRKGEFLYFQASMDPSGRALYADPRRAKNRFIQLFEDLFPLLRNSRALSSETVEKDGNKLIHNHILDFEADNLRFIESDIMVLEPMPAKIVRCMNVFIYFTPDVKKKMMRHINDQLENNGLLILGTNGFGMQSRYAVYKKEAGDLMLQEFAFSPDNLGHLAIMPWFTIHENDPEAILLAELSGAIRSNISFWTHFSRQLDELLEYHGFCERRDDGFLHFPREEMPPNKILKESALLWLEMQKNGCLEGAVDALGKAGYESWINPAGDIAVRPPIGALP